MNEKRPGRIGGVRDRFDIGYQMCGGGARRGGDHLRITGMANKASRVYVMAILAGFCPGFLGFGVLWGGWHLGEVEGKAKKTRRNTRVCAHARATPPPSMTASNTAINFIF